MEKITLLPHDFNQHPGIYLTATILAAVALVYIFIMSPILHKPLPVMNFDECIALPNSIVQESYPSVCITEDGQRFTQVIPQSTNSGQPRP